LHRHISSSQKVGGDFFNPLAVDAGLSDLRSLIWSLRRHKDPDEIDLIRCAIAATESAYDYALRVLRPGLTETELFAGMLGTAAEAVGEFVGEIGNDFQIGSPGGPPRRRPAQAGEVAVLDVSIVIRGYTSDLCRSFVVDRKPSEAQFAAHQRIAEVLSDVEAAIQPGVEACAMYEMAAKKLEGYRGWTFSHHLGHGIGLSAHEAPRLNPYWSDKLETGDVFTIEPGLYGNELRAGLRIEHNYFLSDHGLERLSNFPISLA
jgi:Xaa-Pro aminopeptidase